jgi:hypothetical protein
MAESGRDRHVPLQRRTDEVAVVVSEERVAVLDLDHLDRLPLVLEGTAAAIWERLDGTRTETALVQELAELYDAPEADVAGGVTSFLDELARLDLLLTEGSE